jgi:cytoskeletal protein RodZ
VVVLAGLLLGGVLAHFFGGSGAPQRPAQTTVAEASVPPVTPLPSAAPTSGLPSTAPSPSAAPTSTPSARPTSTPTPTPTPAKHLALAVKPATPTPAPHETPVSTATPPRVAATSKASVATSRPVAVVTPAPAAHPEAPVGDAPASLVRSYLEALAHGDRATASAYLAGGSASETFMTGEAQIESIRSTPGSNSGYQVTADVKSGGAEYNGTFTVVPGPSGLQITDHYWIKPQ